MTDARMIWAYLVISAGTVLVGLGGLVATHGWNKLSELRRRQGLIRAVAGEMVIDFDILNSKHFTETDPQALMRYDVFPRLRTISLDGAISSGMFTDANDMELVSDISRVSQLAADFNQRLAITQQQIDGAEPAFIAKRRREIRDGPMRASVLAAVQSLEKLLIEKYDIRPRERFFVKLNP